MRKSWFYFGWLLAQLGFPPATAQILFDGSLGTSPTAQGWSVAAAAPARSSINDGAFNFDSQGGGPGTRGGLARQAPAPLRAPDGVSLKFTLRVDAETHVSTNRAGVSVILLSDDLRGVELGFWTDRVWAQADSPLFFHAEEAAWDTVAAFVDYELRFSGATYTLSANGQVLLTGPLRNYSAFTGFLNVYQIPNFIFIGDDTTSASGGFSLRHVEVVPVPVPQLSPRRQTEGGLILEWPDTPGWWLQSATVFQNPAVWVPVPEAISVTNGVRSIAIETTFSGRLFRLGQTVDAKP